MAFSAVIAGFLESRLKMLFCWSVFLFGLLDVHAMASGLQRCHVFYGTGTSSKLILVMVEETGELVGIRLSGLYRKLGNGQWSLTDCCLCRMDVKNGHYVIPPQTRIHTNTPIICRPETNAQDFWLATCLNLRNDWDVFYPEASMLFDNTDSIEMKFNTNQQSDITKIRFFENQKSIAEFKKKVSTEKTQLLISASTLSLNSLTVRYHKKLFTLPFSYAVSDHANYTETGRCWSMEREGFKVYEGTLLKDIRLTTLKPEPRVECQSALPFSVNAVADTTHAINATSIREAPCPKCSSLTAAAFKYTAPDTPLHDTYTLSISQEDRQGEKLRKYILPVAANQKKWPVMTMTGDYDGRVDSVFFYDRQGKPSVCDFNKTHTYDLYSVLRRNPDKITTDMVCIAPELFGGHAKVTHVSKQGSQFEITVTRTVSSDTSEERADFDIMSYNFSPSHNLSPDNITQSFLTFTVDIDKGGQSNFVFRTSNSFEAELVTGLIASPIKLINPGEPSRYFLWVKAPVELHEERSGQYRVTMSPLLPQREKVSCIAYPETSLLHVTGDITLMPGKESGTRKLSSSVLCGQGYFSLLDCICSGHSLMEWGSYTFPESALVGGGYYQYSVRLQHRSTDWIYIPRMPAHGHGSYIMQLNRSVWPDDICTFEIMSNLPEHLFPHFRWTAL